MCNEHSRLYIYQNWYEWFPRNQVLILDAVKLTANPSPLLQEAEEFLGVEHKLTSDLFFYGEKKGFFCYKQNEKDKCMPNHKGTAHVKLSDKLNRTLTEYFRPLNQIFFEVANQTFDW